VDRIEAEGIDARLARHRAMAERVWAWCEATGLEILAAPGFRSPTVTAVKCPPGWTGPTVAAAVRAHGYQVATGYGRMKEETFRIGHMGDHDMQGLSGLLEALTLVFG
jgi:aspartate aminotransferase-like enzyme